MCLVRIKWMCWNINWTAIFKVKPFRIDNFRRSRANVRVTFTESERIIGHHKFAGMHAKKTRYLKIWILVYWNALNLKIRLSPMLLLKNVVIIIFFIISIIFRSILFFFFFVIIKCLHLRCVYFLFNIKTKLLLSVF